MVHQHIYTHLSRNQNNVQAETVSIHSMVNDLDAKQIKMDVLNKR